MRDGVASRLVLVVVLATLPTATAHAVQLRERLPAGARIRAVTPPQTDWTTGTVVTADSDRVVLWVAERQAADTLRTRELQALEVSRGRPRLVRGVVGALIGGVLGGTAGAVIGKAASPGEDENLIAAGAGVAGFAGGALAGGGIGALTAPERWRRVAIQR